MNDTKLPPMQSKIQIDEDELKKKLTPEQYQILRQGGTEAPGSSPLLHEKGQGKFACVVCGNQLFSSDAKFDSSIGSLNGWPSFDQAIPGSVELRSDDSYGMSRTEVVCARCGSHLGHVFDDDPDASTGKHFCINGACLLMQKDQTKTE